jgi:hypothetical protein
VRKVAKEPTCTAAGSAAFTCSRCGDSYTEVIAALGHKWTNATCTKPSVCSRCNEHHSDALGHTTSSGRCSRCGLNIKKWIDVPAKTKATLSSLEVIVIRTRETDEMGAGVMGAKTADAGKKLVIFEIQIKNTSEKGIIFSAEDFTLYDGNGREYALYDDAFATDERIKVGTQKGCTLVYHVPEDCQGYYFCLNSEGTNDYYKFYGN